MSYIDYSNAGRNMGNWTMGPTMVSGPATSPYSAAPAPGGPGTYGSTTKPVSGPNGPFNSLGTPLQNNANNLLTAGNNQLNSTYDQSGSIYKAELQKQQNQTNVNEAQRGITMSSYGAGVANQADIGFNSNWQNQLQDRQLKNLAGAEGAMRPATELYNSSYGSSTQGYSTPNAPQSGGGGSGGGAGGQPSYSGLPFPTMNTDPTLPYVPYSSPVSGGPQGFTGDPNMLTSQGQQYNQIVNPTGSDLNSPQQMMDQYTGGYGSTYPLNGPAEPDYNQYYNDYNSSMQNQALNPQSPVINQSGQDYNRIMGISDDTSAVNYLANWSY